jgi:hypothetical protein
MRPVAGDIDNNICMMADSGCERYGHFRITVTSSTVTQCVKVIEQFGENI